MPELKRSIGYLYLEETKFDRLTIRQKKRPAINPVEQFKTYASAEKIELPGEPWKKEHNFWNLLKNRRSKRKYNKSKISLSDLTSLLWATQGITERAGHYFLRTAPSAGALYPIETYLAVDSVDGLKPGLYHLNVFGFYLERLNGQTSTRDIARAALDQSFIVSASVVFIWSAMLRRTMSKYGHRGIRYIFMDSGHICQNLLLAAEAMGLSSCPVAALYENELNSLLGLDGEEETVIYIAPVGMEDKKITI